MTTAVSARLSLALTVQAATDGPFPSLQTYPASVERLALPGGDWEPKVVAATGTIPAASGQVPGTVVVQLTGLARARFVYVENLADPDGAGTANLTVAGPVAATVPRGQMALMTNDRVGWTASAVTLGGTAGTAFKLIVVGD